MCTLLDAGMFQSICYPGEGRSLGAASDLKLSLQCLPLFGTPSLSLSQAVGKVGQELTLTSEAFAYDLSILLAGHSPQEMVRQESLDSE